MTFPCSLLDQWSGVETKQTGSLLKETGLRPNHREPRPKAHEFIEHHSHAVPHFKLDSADCVVPGHDCFCRVLPSSLGRKHI